MNPRRRRSALLLCALAAASLGLTAPAARAQQGPPGPGGGPPPGPVQGGPGPATGPGANPSDAPPPAASVGPDVLAELDATGVAVAKEAAALLDLGGFGSPPPSRLAQAVASVRDGRADATQALAALDTSDRDGARLLASLSGNGVQLPPEAASALSRLSATDRAAAEAGQAISIAPETYVLALDELLIERGGAPSGPPDPTALAAALGSAPVGGSGSSRLPLAAGGILVAALVVGAVAWVRRGRSAVAPRSPSPVALSQLPVAAPPALDHRPIDALLDVSRRLTAATVSSDIERAIVREAMGLVRATAAALVRVGPNGLSVAHQSQPDLLVVDRLGDGLIERVAQTGQPVMQVSATEPAVRFLPVALIGVPLVSGGRVGAVLIEVRTAQTPFGAAEQERLMALAPVAAAALQSAQEAAAAIEESLVDPLTGVGNRRRLDGELAEVLARGGGRPTALIMVDLDKFKRVNDEHGHPAGDALLKGLAGVLRDTVRPGDGVYRYGGEEFVVVLPRTSEAAAAEVAERVRGAIEATPFDIGGAGRLRATASFGVASSTSNDPSGLVARADAALYRAKGAGRNRVVSAGSGDPVATNVPA